MRVAIQGELGAFHQLAAVHWFGKDTVEFVPCRDFAGVFRALEEKRAEQAVVAIENSNYGSITDVYDLLRRYHFPIIGEISERVHQQLIGLPGAKLADITEVISQSPALGQCSVFLDNKLPQAQKIEYYDTAAAVRLVGKRQEKHVAAVGSSLAAEINGLEILASNIENADQNYTRFFVLNTDTVVPIHDANKSSLLLETSHEAGALYKALGVFAKADINLTKLQSRPAPEKVWKYQFYLDVMAAGQQMLDAIEELESQGCHVEHLGSYKADATEYED